MSAAFQPKDAGHETWTIRVEGYAIDLFKRRYPDGRRSEKWYCAFKLPGQKMVCQSTDCTTKDRAKEVARLKFLAAHEGRFEALRGSTLRQRELVLGDVLPVYREGIAARSEGIRQRTIVSNISALRSMIRAVKGEQSAERMDNLRLAELDREFVLDYKERALGQALERGAENPKTSLNSTMAQARSIFSREARELYKDRGLVLPPSIEAWLQVPRFSAKEEDLSFEPIEERVLAAMDREIAQEVPAVRAIYTMARWLGMRAGEIAAARWEWLEEWPTGWRMVIKRRTYWKGPKGLRTGMVAVREDVRAVIEACGDRASQWIIGGANETERERVLLDAANVFIRRHLPAREKGLHELRKQAGSMVYTQSGLTAAAEFLRNTAAVCRKHYATLLHPVEPPRMVA